MMRREPVRIDKRMADGSGDDLPLMDVLLSWEGVKRSCVALIDSGAALIHVHKPVLTLLGSPVLAGPGMRMQTVHATSVNGIHPITMTFPVAGLSSTVMEVVEMDLSGRSYEVILGALFIKGGILHLDYTSESYFHFH